MILIGLFFCIVYGVVHLYNLSFWKPQKLKKKPDQPLPFVSIIVPIRNEATNIKACLKSITSNTYPHDKYEIIVIDDFSTDNSFQIISELNHPKVSIVQMKDSLVDDSESHKKVALKKGIEKSRGNLIIQTDGDTLVPTDWLNLHVQNYNKKKICSTGPIKIDKGRNLLTNFQALDNIGMMAVTNAGIKSGHWHLANGANMSYIKETAGIEQGMDLASGDDVFKIQELAKVDKRSVDFILSQNSIVTTAPMNSFFSFFQQRKRWASKNAKYTSKKLNGLMGFIWVTNIYLVLITIVFPLQGIIIWSIKGFLDTVYLLMLMPFFNVKMSSLKIFTLTFFHTLYIIWFGIFAIVPSSYHWKNRQLS